MSIVKVRALVGKEWDLVNMDGMCKDSKLVNKFELPNFMFLSPLFCTFSIYSHIQPQIYMYIN
jgi:hypothetical protein